MFVTYAQIIQQKKCTFSDSNNEKRSLFVSCDGHINSSDSCKKKKQHFNERAQYKATIDSVTQVSLNMDLSSDFSKYVRVRAEEVYEICVHNKIYK